MACVSFGFAAAPAWLLLLSIDAPFSANSSSWRRRKLRGTRYSYFLPATLAILKAEPRAQTHNKGRREAERKGTWYAERRVGARRGGRGGEEGVDSQLRELLDRGERSSWPRSPAQWKGRSTAGGESKERTDPRRQPRRTLVLRGSASGGDAAGAAVREQARAYQPAETSRERKRTAGRLRAAAEQHAGWRRTSSSAGSEMGDCVRASGLSGGAACVVCVGDGCVVVQHSGRVQGEERRGGRRAEAQAQQAAAAAAAAAESTSHCMVVRVHSTAAAAPPLNPSHRHFARCNTAPAPPTHHTAHQTPSSSRLHSPVYCLLRLLRLCSQLRCPSISSLLYRPCPSSCVCRHVEGG